MVDHFHIPGMGVLHVGQATPRQFVLPNPIAHALDQQLATARAISVLVRACAAGQIARIHVMQSCLQANLRRADQIIGRRIVRIEHPVVFVECRHVPRDIGRHGCDKACRVPDLFSAIVETRHHQRHDLRPDAALFHHLDPVEHVVQRRAQLPIILVLHRLQIDLYPIRWSQNNTYWSKET